MPAMRWRDSIAEPWGTIALAAFFLLWAVSMFWTGVSEEDWLRVLGGAALTAVFARVAIRHLAMLYEVSIEGGVVTWKVPFRQGSQPASAVQSITYTGGWLISFWDGRYLAIPDREETRLLLRGIIIANPALSNDGDPLTAEGVPPQPSKDAPPVRAGWMLRAFPVGVVFTIAGICFVSVPFLLTSARPLAAFLTTGAAGAITWAGVLLRQRLFGGER